ncbi:MAG: septum formation initiator family protein [Muribaculaceae bacterium]
MSRSILSWGRRYLSVWTVLLVGAILYLLFFQENSSSRIYAYQQTIDSLNAEIKMNRDTMLYYHELNRRLDNRDPEIIERVVREHFNMNTPDEEVYLFK